MKHALILAVVLYCMAKQLFAQSQFETDNLYETELQVYNTERSTLKLSDFKGKYVVLDFWGFNCIGCVKSFPKVDSIQKKFADDIQILLVGRNSAAETDSFFKKFVKVKKPDIPMIVSDSVLFKTFNVSSVPVHIYLDRDGHVIYETSNDGKFTAENLTQLIQGADIKLPQRFKKSYPKTILKPEYSTYVDVYSCLSRSAISHQFASSPDLSEGFKIQVHHKSIPMMYQIAYAGLLGGKEVFFDRPGKTIAKCTDTTNLYFPSAENWREWIETYAYDYQLYWKNGERKKSYERFIKELDEISNLEVSIQKKKVRCLVLKPLKDIGILRSKGGEPYYNLVRKEERRQAADSIYTLNNVPFEDFISSFQIPLEHMYAPFFNETGFSGNIDFSISADTFEEFQLDRLMAHLKTYGLRLTTAKRKINVMIIKDKRESP